MNVTSIFKPADTDARVLILHSTEDDLGERTANELKGNLHGVVVVGLHRIADFREFLERVQASEPFNVLVLIAHGNRVSNRVRLFADVDENGRPLRLNVGELKAALDGHVDDALCLFGVCHFGTDDLATAVCHQAGALACIAPKAAQTISRSEIVHDLAALLNQLQRMRSQAVGTGDLDKLLAVVSPPVHAKLDISVGA